LRVDDAAEFESKDLAGPTADRRLADRRLADWPTADRRTINGCIGARL